MGLRLRTRWTGVGFPQRNVGLRSANPTYIRPGDYSWQRLFEMGCQVRNITYSGQVTMMKSGIFKAKTLFTSLLEKVKRGGKVLIITKRGRPVARLVSNEHALRAKIENAIQELRAHRSGLKLNGLSWQDLRDTGRR